MDTFTLLFGVLCLMFIIVKLINRKSKEDRDKENNTCDDESFPRT